MPALYRTIDWTYLVRDLGTFGSLGRLSHKQEGECQNHKHRNSKSLQIRHVEHLHVICRQTLTSHPKHQH